MSAIKRTLTITLQERDDGVVILTTQGAVPDDYEALEVSRGMLEIAMASIDTAANSDAKGVMRNVRPSLVCSEWARPGARRFMYPDEFPKGDGLKPLAAE